MYPSLNNNTNEHLPFDLVKCTWMNTTGLNGYYDFYRHHEDKNNCEVLDNYAEWSGCDITITTEIHARSLGSLHWQ